MTLDWVVLGDGGHARAVGDVIARRGERVVAVYGKDSGPRPMTSGSAFAAEDDDAAARWAADHGAGISLGVGDVHLRARMIDALETLLGPDHPSLRALVDPTATVSGDARLGAAAQVFAHAHIGPGAWVDAGVLVNTAGVVEHDARVGRASHIAPHATLLGGAAVGSQCLVGAGAVILIDVAIGSGSTVGAGAVVTRDQPPRSLLLGVPARHHGKVSND